MKITIFNHWKFILLFLFISFFYLYKLGSIPNGLFCDEAEIGVQAYRLLHGEPTTIISPFFYNHFGYMVGNLEVLTALPFVAIFGLSDFSIRFVSAFYAILTLIVIFLILSYVKLKNRTLSILYIGLTPIFFHIARINFGHFPAIFFIIIGFYFFLLSKAGHFLSFSIISGFCFSVSLYGYNAFMIATPLFLFLLLISELIINRKNLKCYKNISITLFIFILLALPIIINFLTNQTFKKRLLEKNHNKSFVSKEEINNVKNNYGKYYSLDYLFTKGEVGMPGGNNTRHFVRGKGIFYIFSGFLLISGLIIFLRKKVKPPHFILPFILLIFFYPSPDIVTTLSISPPYTFAIFSTILFFPFLIALSNHYIGNRRIFLFIYFFLFVVEFLNFYFILYKEYPGYSSDYWGWQAGSKEIVNYMVSQKNNYDQLFIAGDFNGGSQVFLDFYDPEKKCPNCFAGGIEMYDQEKKQLFAMRISSYNQYVDKNTFKINKTVYLPSGQPEYYIGEYGN